MMKTLCLFVFRFVDLDDNMIGGPVLLKAMAQ